MITELKLQNFKKFEELKLKFRPITLLSGLNGMGKSSVVQAILLIQQSQDADLLVKHYLDLTGNLVELGHGKDVLYEGAANDKIGIAIEQKRSGYIFLEAQYEESAERLRLINDASGFPAKIFDNNLQYLCAERLGPRKSLPLSESFIRDRNIGKQGEYVFHALLHYGSEKLSDSDPRVLMSQEASIKYLADAWLREISPGVRLDLEAIHALDAARGSYSYLRAGDIPSTGFRPTNVGFGISYALPIIVASLLCREGDILIVENPEAHIHPRGQTKLAHLLAAVAQIGAQVIIETHSDHVMNGMRVLVKEQQLSGDQIAFHYFGESQSGKTEINSPSIDKEGRLSSWPSGFFDEHEENLARLISS